VEDWQLILVANGLALSQELQDFARSLSGDVEILNLPHKELPGKARNLALEKVRHEWIFFIDDDAYLLPRYFEIVQPLLENEKIEVLGGPDAPAKSMDRFSEALALTLSSPFCTGSTYARHRPKGSDLQPASEEILTSCNLWLRRRLIEEVKFPETYLRTEETSLLLELKRRGARMFYHPKMSVGHHRRKTFSSLLRPTFYAGFYRSQVMRDQRLGVGKFWLPMIFVLLHLSLFFHPVLFLLLARIYLGIIVMMSLNLASRRRKLSLFLEITLLHYFIVFIYGVGFLVHRLGWHGSNRRA
jgi:GT2 family glycosyltransferase